MTDWYYEEDGQQRGPVTRDMLGELLYKETLNANTRVWTAEFGPVWKRAVDTDLLKDRRHLPPPLQPTAESSSNSIEKTEGVAVGRRDRASEADSDFYAKVIAYSPLILMPIDVLVALLGTSPESNLGQQLRILPVVLIIALTMLDADGLVKAGRNPDRRWIVPFMIFLTPIGYFIRRHFVVGNSLRYLWIWLAALVAYVVFAVPLEWFS